MRQEAKVLSINGELATVAVVRKSACAHDCADCGGCGAQKTITVSALNMAGAKTGDFVTVESDDSSVLKKAFLLYIAPLIAFFAAYAMMSVAGMGETASSFGGIVVLALSFAAVKIYDGKMGAAKDLPTIVEIIEQ